MTTKYVKAHLTFVRKILMIAKSFSKITRQNLNLLEEEDHKCFPFLLLRMAGGVIRIRE